MILKYPQNGSLKGIFTLLLAYSQQENLLRISLGSGERAVFTIPALVHHIEAIRLSTT